ncbi:uncharacterized protein LOC143767439 [Ranitomeya variabilis]|uniref:uncharacterized protein LOC143767439 n=1 Tax=Ranitomeya variabilis TaxID=490064 RepID=UPI004056ADDC
MDLDRDKMVKRILHLTLEIIFRLTGEDYTVVKKTPSERCQDPVSEGWGRPLSQITGTPPHPLIHEDINDQKILELTYKIIELLTGEVPIRCQDVAIYFSMEEWEYSERHKDVYKDVIMEVSRPLTSTVLSSKRTTPERCPRPLLPQDCKQENPNVPQDHQGKDLTHINTTETYVRGDERCKEESPTYDYPGPYNIGSLSGELYKKMFLIGPSRIGRDKMVERILHVTLEILFRLTGEDYTVVTKTSSEHCQTPVSERPLSPITGPPPLPFIHEDIKDQKILQLTYKMIELLIGEVPIRCQDVAVYFSLEEWEYVEGRKDLYKDVMMEVPQHLTTRVLSSKMTTPERCPRPLVPQDCKQENHNVPQDHQGKDLTHINTTETYVRGDEWCKEEIPTYDYPAGEYIRSAKRHVRSDLKLFDDDITQDEEHVSIPDLTSALQSKDLSSDPFQQVLSPGSLQKNKNKRKNAEHERSPKITAKVKGFSCPECGKCFTTKSKLVIHEKIHKVGKPYSCSTCGACFNRYWNLKIHEGSHTGVKPFSCLECGKCFLTNAKLVRHEKIHKVEKPYSCSTCGACFKNCSNFIRHEASHTGLKPFSCSECEKRFTRKSDLVIHQRIHTGEKPFLCTECGKCFCQKTHLVKHLRCHTGETPHPCSECGKCFTTNTKLVRHERVHKVKPYSCSTCGAYFKTCWNLKRHHEGNHTGKKPYSCTECGKSFATNTKLVRHERVHKVKPYSCSTCGAYFNHLFNLIRHERTHTGVKPFLCSECGKCFSRKADLVDHQRIHTGEKPFLCTECGKCFNQKAHLAQHLRSHRGEKPYSCSECGKCYSQKSHLTVHQKSHTGGKPYSCLECGTYFKRKSDLVTHQQFTHVISCSDVQNLESVSTKKSRYATPHRSHTGEMPLSGLESRKLFSKASHLVDHDYI